MKTSKSRQSRNPHRRKVIATLILALVLPSLSGRVSAQESVRVEWSPNPESDIAGYTVYLGTSSGNYSIRQNVINKATTILSGLTPSTTYFCAVQAYNTVGLTSEMSDEVSFTTQPFPEFFQNWATSGGLSGPATAAAAMPFNDGVCNLLKYAFNMNASGPDRRMLAPATGNVGLPVFAYAKEGTQSIFRVEFLRRKGGELVYVPKISTDLSHYSPMTGSTSVTGINDRWERVTIRQTIDLAKMPRLFGIVEVSQVLTPTTLFNTWATDAGLGGMAATTDALPFNDGVTNLLKYAFNMTSAGPDTHVLAKGTGTAGLPVFALEQSGSQTWFTVEFLRRKNSGLIYTPRISTDLIHFEPLMGAASVSPINDGWERVVLRRPVDTASTPRLFANFEVSLP